MNDKPEALIESLYTRGLGICRDFTSTEESHDLLNALLAKESSLREAGIGKANEYSRVKEIRSDKIAWLEKNEDALLDRLFFHRVEELKLAINRRCFLGLNDYEFHFAKYERGAFYKRHKDVFKSDDARKISVILYLNSDWKQGDGGELKIYTENEEITVQPKAGTLVIFESHIEHEVLTSNTNRFSITGWMKNVKDIF